MVDAPGQHCSTSKINFSTFGLYLLNLTKFLRLRLHHEAQLHRPRISLIQNRKIRPRSSQYLKLKNDFLVLQKRNRQHYRLKSVQCQIKQINS